MGKKKHRSEKKYREKKERVRTWLEAKGHKMFSDIDILKRAYEELGIKKPFNTLMNHHQIKGSFSYVYNCILKRGVTKRQTGLKSERKIFYRSTEWRRLRYRVLERDGNKCQCCGRSRRHGVILHVDHIKPLRDYWHLRLDAGNLQVLCDQCNLGKSADFETDWR